MNVALKNDHNASWRQLIAAVMILAVFDADKGDGEAEEWLQSDGAENCLAMLGLPYSIEDLAQRERYPRKRRRLPIRPPKTRKKKR